MVVSKAALAALALASLSPQGSLAFQPGPLATYRAPPLRQAAARSAPLSRVLMQRMPQDAAASKADPRLAGAAAGLSAAAITLLGSVAAFAAGPEAADAGAAVAAEAGRVAFEPRGITVEDTAVFVIGCIPFVWAAISFWTRIANGEPFGTGKDSVVIDTGREDWKADTGGSRRILSAGAMRIAYLLMAAAAFSVALVFVAASQLPATIPKPP